MKLSTKQKEVIQKMREGEDASWNLSTSAGGYYKIGSSFSNGNTFNSLLKKGLVKYGLKTWRQHIYELTELGKSITI